MDRFRFQQVRATLDRRKGNWRKAEGDLEYDPVSEIGPLPRFGGQLHHVKPRFPGIRARAGR